MHCFLLTRNRKQIHLQKPEMSQFNSNDRNRNAPGVVTIYQCFKLRGFASKLTFSSNCAI